MEDILMQGGAVSPIVTIEPRRRKFHRAITVTIPLPERVPTHYNGGRGSAMGGGGSVGSSRKTSSESLHKMHLTGGCYCYFFDKRFSRNAHFESSRVCS